MCWHGPIGWDYKVSMMPWRCVMLIGKSECGFKVEINADICGGVIERDTVIGLDELTVQLR